MISLEDLWLERQPQNVPGTSADWNNWRRRAQLTLDEMLSEPTILERLREIDRLRRTGQ
jgi:4-alpha-glucanotransferase